jgi:hypothetical protein
MTSTTDRLPTAAPRRGASRVAYLGTLDHLGVLGASDLREPSHVYVFGSLGEARRMLKSYAEGRRNIWVRPLLHTEPSTLDGAGYGSTHGEEGPMLTLWSIALTGDSGEGDMGDALAAWEYLSHDSDPCPDSRVIVGPRGGTSVQPC